MLHDCMAVLFLVNVLLLTCAVHNKLVKTTTALGFLTPSLTILSPQMVFIVLSAEFSSSLVFQGCTTLMVETRQIGNSSQALWPLVYLLIQLFISHMVSMNFRPPK